MIICRAPVRIDFGGGGTDIEPYSSEHTGFVVNSTINKYIRTIVAKRNDKMIKIISSDFSTIIEKESINDLTYDSSLDLIKGLIKRVNPNSGLDLFTRGDIPPKSGLGASASLSTSIIGALTRLMDKKLSDGEIAEIGYLTEHDDLKNEGGRQDQYASVFGGFNQIEFLGDNNVKVSKLNIKSSFSNYLNKNMVLVYTGNPHTSGNIISRQVESYNKKEDVAVESLHKVKEIAQNIRDSLLNENFENFAKALTQDWEFKTKLNPLITTERMRMLNKIALSNGAIGGRVCGAGGGGCMIWVCKEGTKEAVISNLKKENTNEIKYEFNNKGYEIIDF
jgi:D-glycero-alpha-D-manno-heptose-7-phosphate kinase